MSIKSLAMISSKISKLPQAKASQWWKDKNRQDAISIFNKKSRFRCTKRSYTQSLPSNRISLMCIIQAKRNNPSCMSRTSKNNLQKPIKHFRISNSITLLIRSLIKTISNFCKSANSEKNSSIRSRKELPYKWEWLKK